MGWNVCGIRFSGVGEVVFFVCVALMEKRSWGRGRGGSMYLGHL